MYDGIGLILYSSIFYRFQVIKPPLAIASSGFKHRCYPSVRSFVCLSVCLSPKCVHKTWFSQKLSNLELWSLLTTYNLHESPYLNEQELSYRKQIARKLRTQFVEGISVTLKSTLRVTQGHWKRNHWTDHTRLTTRRVILDVEYHRDLEMWVRGHSRSLKLVPFERLGAVSYSPSIVTVAVSVAVCDIFNVK